MFIKAVSVKKILPSVENLTCIDLSITVEPATVLDLKEYTNTPNK